MHRMRFFEPLALHALTRHQGTTSPSSAIEKTRPRPPRISQWSLPLTTFRSTRFTELSPLAVRGVGEY